MIHTPHRDKRAGTLRTMDVLKEHKFDPARCVIDHNNEETIREVLDRGYWVAFSIYPQTKMGSERMAVLVENYGPERLIVDSACDWGVSDPLAVAKTARLMAQRGVSADAIHKVVYSNALAVYGLNGEMDEQHWLAPARDRPEDAVRGQFGAARRPDAAHRATRTSRGRVTDRLAKACRSAN